MHIKNVLSLPRALIALVFGGTVFGAVRTYPIPEFDDREWKEEKKEQVWVDADVKQIWIALELIQTWIAPTTKPVYIGPVYITIPATYKEEWVGPTGDTVNHPAEIGIRTVPADGYWQHTDATTKEHEEEWHNEPNPPIEYDYWVEDLSVEYGWVGSYWDDEWEEWYDVYDFYIVDHGWWEHGTRDGGSRRVKDKDAWTEEIPAKDDFIETSPAHPEEYEVRGPWSEWVETSPGHYVTVPNTPEHEEEVSAGHWEDKEDQAGYWLTEQKPGTGCWVTIEVTAGHYEERTTPGGWKAIVIPASTLGVTDDGQSITDITWTTGRPVGMPSYVSAYLNDPEFLVEDNEDPTVWSPSLAFGFRIMVPMSRVGRATLKRGLPIGAEVLGRWGILIDVPVVVPIDADEANRLIEIFITDAAISLSQERTNNPREVWSYVDYESIEINAMIGVRRVYSGLARGWGTPDQVLLRRYPSLSTPRPGFAYPLINTSLVLKAAHADGYAAMRGREQQLIDWHGDHAANAIRGVRSDKEFGLHYHNMSDLIWGALSPYTGSLEGQIELPNEWPWGVGLLLPPFARPPLSH